MASSAKSMPARLERVGSKVSSAGSERVEKRAA